MPQVSAGLFAPPVYLSGARECCRVRHRFATELTLKTREPGFANRVADSRSWLSQGGEDGF